MRSETSSPARPIECLLVSSFNLTNLAALLSNDQGWPLVRAISAPFGQVMQTLLDETQDVWSDKVSGTLVWASPESVSTGYKRLRDGEEVQAKEILSQVDEFSGAVKRIPSSVKYILIPSWTTGPFEGQLGLMGNGVPTGNFFFCRSESVEDY